MSVYSNPQPLQQPDIQGAVYDFVKAYALPQLPDTSIFRAFQNRSFLPPDNNEFAVISVLQGTRRGTNTRDFTANNTYTTAMLMEVPVQVDFYGNDETPLQRASALALLGRDIIGAEFFAPYGISPLYTDDVRDLSALDQSEQYVKRFTITLYLAYWASQDVTVQYFDKVRITRLENVDEHHTS